MSYKTFPWGESNAAGMVSSDKTMIISAGL